MARKTRARTERRRLERQQRKRESKAKRLEPEPNPASTGWLKNFKSKLGLPNWLPLAAGAVIATVAVISLLAINREPSQQSSVATAPTTAATPQKTAPFDSIVLRCEDLLDKSDAELAEMDIAAVNLAVASGMVHVPDSLDPLWHRLDTWAARAKTEIQRHQYRYQQDPAHYENSWGKFAILLMNVVLKEDFRVRYNPERIEAPEDLKTGLAGFEFFRNPNDIFLTGLLGDQRMGTCSSLPVLYAAVGRRLGFPIKLSCTRGHLFCRWDGNGERFNFEVTNKGVSFPTDDHFREWPFPITPEEEA